MVTPTVELAGELSAAACESAYQRFLYLPVIEVEEERLGKIAEEPVDCGQAGEGTVP
jgi:hypothetical protein